MPCGSCIPDPLAAYYVVDSYVNSHPGKVLFYLADDYANTSCSSLNAWAGNLDMTCTTFSDANVKMSDYGTPGMPKIVVLAGTNHKVFFNKNSSSQGIGTAIDQALASVGIDENEVSNIEVSVFPNPAQDLLNVQFILSQSSEVDLEIVDISGASVMQLVTEDQKEIGDYNIQVNISALSSGYFIKATTETGIQKFKFSVSH